MRHRIARLVLTTALGWAVTTSPHAQPPVQPPADCLQVSAMNSKHLVGTWQVVMYDGPLPDGTNAVAGRPVRRGLLWLEPHPEHQDTVRGALRWEGAATTQWLSGDLEEGELLMDESADGRRISAVWVAHPTPAGCGHELKGNRRSADDDRIEPLMLRRTSPRQGF